MSAPRIFVLSAAPYWRQAMAYIDNTWSAQARAGRPLVVRVTEDKATRTTAQNALMWAVLTDISEQVEWHGQRLTPEDWKHVLTASLRKQRAVPGLDGGFVVLGTPTSRMTIGEMTELIELAHAFGAQRGVTFAQERAA